MAQKGEIVNSTRKSVFWASAAVVVLGVVLHFPDFWAARSDHFMMAGMGMSQTMRLGMVLILAGLVTAGLALIPDRRELRLGDHDTDAGRFRAIDGARLRPAHWRLVTILTIGLVVDTMKPASLGFTLPGVAMEYHMTTAGAATLPFVAIAGTVVGSVLWGYLSDLLGRRATLMYSGLIYIGASICGFMPTFGWNLVMCFVMGAAAGGMLPTVYSLTAESIPARRRGALIVLQSGMGAALGYLVASGAASLLMPYFGWRILWLLGLPTGALLLVMCRWVPESPRYLLARGHVEEANRVMARYGIRSVDDGPDERVDRPDPAVPAVPTVPTVPAEPAGRRTEVLLAPAPAPPARRRRAKAAVLALMVPPYRRGTVTVVLYGLGWGVVNWGFITFLPTFLSANGGSGGANNVLFFSSLFAAPNTVLAAYLYGRWSSRRSMILYSSLTVAVLLGFTMLNTSAGGPGAGLFVLLAVLLASSGGMIAMLSPYSTELYPTSLRASGSGLAAASSKIGGLVGPMLLTSAPHAQTAAILTALPVVAAIAVMFLLGVETSGRPLVEAAPV